MKDLKNLDLEKFEPYIWSAIIIITITNLFFPLYLEQNTLLYFLFGIVIICALLYVDSRRLYRESKLKTQQLIKTQREIINHQKMIDLIFNNSEDGILALDQDQRIVSFSPGMERISGYTKEEALGFLAQNLLKFRGGKDNSLLPDLMFVQSGVKKHPYIRNLLITKDGREISIEASYTLTKDTKSHALTGIAIIRDVTYEEELIRRDKEFIAITSHQMNTPLSIIRGYISLLKGEKAGKISQTQKQYLEEIYSSVLKLISITNNLLSISRIEQEKIKLQKDDLNLRELILQVGENFQKLAADKHIALEVTPPNQDILIYADRDKLYQAFSNLIDNAIKYTPKGSVKVSVEKKSNEIEIEVKDTGIGISDEEIDRIGQKFYRTQSAIDLDNKGTGLGLFIAKTIVEKHSGSLEIKSNKNKGTSIIIRLPLK